MAALETVNKIIKNMVHITHETVISPKFPTPQFDFLLLPPKRQTVSVGENQDWEACFFRPGLGDILYMN